MAAINLDFPNKCIDSQWCFFAHPSAAAQPRGSGVISHTYTQLYPCILLVTPVPWQKTCFSIHGVRSLSRMVQPLAVTTQSLTIEDSPNRNKLISMQRIQSPLDRSFSLSRIAMGLWRLADWKYTSQQTLELLEQLLELGVTTFDLADIYGDYRCERLFGDALKLKPELRGKMEIVSKCGIKLMSDNNNYALNHYDSSGTHVTAAVESSLENMRIEQLDLLLIHRPDPLMDADELAETLDGLVSGGKVRAVGVSNFLPHQVQLLQSRLSTPLLVNQIEVSLLHSAPLFDGQLDYCQRERIIPMAWSPFAGGELFTGGGEAARRVQACLEELSRELDMEPQQLALAWLLKHPSNMAPVLGSGRVSRLRNGVAALGRELPREAWFRLLRAARGRDVD